MTVRLGCDPATTHARRQIRLHVGGNEWNDYESVASPMMHLRGPPWGAHGDQCCAGTLCKVPTNIVAKRSGMSLALVRRYWACLYVACVKAIMQHS